MSDEIKGSRRGEDATAETPAGSGNQLAVWVSPQVVDTRIVSKTAKGGRFAENQANDTGGVYKAGS